MRVYFLGTGGAGGPLSRAHNCFLVESEGSRILLDFGEGCSWRLASLGMKLCDADIVYISHSHPDHWSGLHDALIRGVIEGCSNVVLGMHEEVYAELKDIIAYYLPSEARALVKYKVINDEVRVGDLRISPAKSHHTVPTYGLFIVSDAGNIYYTADTRLDISLSTYLRNAELVIHEATIPDGLERIAYEKGHTTVSQAVNQSKTMREGSLLAIVHLSLESEKQILEGRVPRPYNNVRVIVPYDLMVLSI